MKHRALLVFAVCAMAVSVAVPPREIAAQDQSADNSNPNEVTVPEGTEFKLQLHTTINSKTSKPGDRIVTTLIDPVSVEDQDVLPKGVRIDGHVGDVKAAARRGKGGYLSIVFDTVELPNGEKVAMLGSLTEIFSSEGKSDPNVGPEGDLKGKGPSRKKQLAIVALPTAAAAATGSVGAAVALGIGATVAAILVPHGQQATLEAGSLIGMRLDRDLNFNLPPRAK